MTKPEQTFQVGDIVNVLHPVCLGTPRTVYTQQNVKIERVTYHSAESTIVPAGTPIYWVEGRKTGCDARLLEKAVR